MRILIALVAGIVAGPVAAQAPATIDPGMTRSQVVAKLGEPLSMRTYEGYTYLLYKNGCEKKCGMNDLVVLDSGRVIDAIFRSRSRRFSGTSSSPQMIPAADAKRGAAGAPLKTPEPPAAKPKASRPSA